MTNTPNFDALLSEFYRENPEHIAGIVKEASVPTGERVQGNFLDSESLRAFFTWLVAAGKRDRETVARVWMCYHERAPEDFPLPFPWEKDA